MKPAAQAVEPTHAHTADQMIAVAAGDAGRAGLAARRAGDRDRRETVAVTLAVILDQHRLADADQAVEPARAAVLLPPRGAGPREP